MVVFVLNVVVQPLVNQGRTIGVGKLPKESHVPGYIVTQMTDIPDIVLCIITRIRLRVKSRLVGKLEIRIRKLNGIFYE